MRRFLSAMVSGLFISLGAVVYFMINNPILGGIFFSIGILLVIHYDTLLFTKVVPMYFAKMKYKLSDIPITFLGNALGCMIMALAIRFTSIMPKMVDGVEKAGLKRLDDSFLSLFILAILCAFMVAFASFFAKKFKKDNMAQIVYVMLFISAFIICCFEHVVADVFYLFLYGLNFSSSLSMIWIILIVLLGNFVGGMIIGLVHRKVSLD